MDSSPQVASPTIGALWEQYYKQVDPTEILFPEREATQALTYKQINASAYCLAAYFLQQNMPRGRAALMIGGREPSYLAMDLAAQLAGFANVTLPADAEEDVILQAAARHEPAVVLLGDYATYRKYKSALDRIAADAPIICDVDDNRTQLSEDDRIATMMRVMETGKIFWRNNREEMQARIDEVAPGHSSVIAYFGVQEPEWRECAHEAVVAEFNSIRKQVKKLRAKDFWYALAKPSGLSGKTLSFYYPVFSGRKICVFDAPDGLLPGKTPHKPGVFAGASDQFCAYFDAAAKTADARKPGKRRALKKSLDVASKIYELEQKKKKVPLGLKLKWQWRHKGVFKQFRQRYYRHFSAYVLIPDDARPRAELLAYALELELLVLREKAG